MKDLVGDRVNTFKIRIQIRQMFPKAEPVFKVT